MRKLRSLPLLVTGALLAFAVLPGTAGSAPPESSIDSVNVACVGGSFELTVGFTHRGAPLEVRVYEYAAGTAIDSQARWYHGPRETTFVGQLVGGTSRTFSAHLLRVDRRADALVDIVPPVTTGTYSCPA